MKIITKPQEYEAVRFNGSNYGEIEKFLRTTGCLLLNSASMPYISTLVGNILIESGDIIYKGQLTCSVLKHDSNISQFFEVVE